MAIRFQMPCSTTPDGKPGLKADYSEFACAGFGRGPEPPVLASRTEPNINLTDSNLPAEVAGKKTVGVRWTGFLTATDTGDYLVGVRGNGFGRLSIDDKQVAQIGQSRRSRRSRRSCPPGKGQKAALSLHYGSMNGTKPHAQLIWAKVNDAPSPEAIAAAKNADIVIAVVGITSRLEGEEMPVTDTWIPRWRSHQHRSSPAGRSARGSSSSHRQATRRRSVEWQRPGCQLDQRSRQRGSRSMVPRRRRRRGCR